MRISTALAFALLFPVACDDGSASESESDGTGADTGSMTGNPTTGTSGPNTSNPGTSMSTTGTSGNPVTTADDSSPGQTEGSDTDGGGTDGPSDSSGSGGMTGDGDSMGESSEGGSSGGSVDQLPPTDGAAIVEWLEAETYTGWAAESAIHGSSGPHGDVRTFVNDLLFSSLVDGLADHPEEAATVKELYDGGSRVGWAVMVKVQPDSDDGDGWYWYEIIDGSVIADGNGVTLCSGCHSDGLDYVLTPFPLQ